MNKKPKTLINCIVCGSQFQTYPYEIKRGNGKYCSRKCSGVNNLTKIKKGQRLSVSTEFKKGDSPWNKSLLGFGVWPKWSAKGQKNPAWKGDKVGYFGLHLWIANNYGKINRCDVCGVSSADKKYHWANLSGKYIRNVSDWKRMCVSCHSKYDKSWLKRERDSQGRFS